MGKKKKFNKKAATYINISASSPQRKSTQPEKESDSITFPFFAASNQQLQKAVEEEEKGEEETEPIEPIRVTGSPIPSTFLYNLQSDKLPLSHSPLVIDGYLESAIAGSLWNVPFLRDSLVIQNNRSSSNSKTPVSETQKQLEGRRWKWNSSTKILEQERTLMTLDEFLLQPVPANSNSNSNSNNSDTRETTGSTSTTSNSTTTTTTTNYYLLSRLVEGPLSSFSKDIPWPPYEPSDLGPRVEMQLPGHSSPLRYEERYSTLVSTLSITTNNPNTSISSILSFCSPLLCFVSILMNQSQDLRYQREDESSPL